MRTLDVICSLKSHGPYFIATVWSCMLDLSRSCQFLLHPLFFRSVRSLSQDGRRKCLWWRNPHKVLCPLCEYLYFSVKSYSSLHFHFLQRLLFYKNNVRISKYVAWERFSIVLPNDCRETCLHTGKIYISLWKEWGLPPKQWLSWDWSRWSGSSANLKGDENEDAAKQKI